MPHCIIEHSKSLTTTLPISTMMDKIFTIMNKTNCFTATAIKVRAKSFEYERIEGKCSSFIHVTIKILEGRPQELRQAITSAIFDYLHTILNPQDTQISVDCHEMDAETYKK